MTEPGTRYVRYATDGGARYGILEADTIHQLGGPPFDTQEPTGSTLPLAEATLLAPCEPSKVIAVGLNYRSHLGERTAPEYPGLFAKFPTSIIGTDADIVMPADAQDVHFEGEIVVVIGKTSSKLTPAEAPAHIFGVTAGNDVSERLWQRGDLQWVRAKGSDTFGPLGPAIACGLDYGDLQLETRLNGEVLQSARSRDLLFDIDTIVSYVSTYVTLEPGDLVFTGTPGTTRPMLPGDVVEVEVEGVGVLRNTVTKATA